MYDDDTSFNESLKTIESDHIYLFHETKEKKQNTEQERVEKKLNYI